MACVGDNYDLVFVGQNNEVLFAVNNNDVVSIGDNYNVYLLWIGMMRHFLCDDQCIFCC